MGILTMNIAAFGLIEPAYLNPLAQPGADGGDIAVYLINFLFFDGKMRGLFSFLFGASMLMVILRAKAGGNSAIRTHYARMVWLLVFGLIHLWLMWWGDILTLYALVGMIAWFFRTQPPHKLIAGAIALMVAQFALMLLLPFGIFMMQLASHQPDAGEQVHQALTQFRHGFGIPEREWSMAQIALYRSGYGAILNHRMETAFSGPVNSLIFSGAETLAYMMLGMACLKSGFLSGEAPRATYRKWVLIGFGVGLPVYALLAALLLLTGFTPLAVAAIVMTATVPVRPLMIMGWAALIILAIPRTGALSRRIAAAGRMAFSNYLGTSLLCTFLFYGYGTGWYGMLDRAQLYLVVFAVWAIILLWSEPWLRHFRYGPLEWLWRCCARGKLQPLRGSALAPPANIATHPQ
ncbi:DUF418 domain-containing protein [Stakelama sp. CBK3Z-3]|uniref:DUF418 domain-containing protein n=2 Tax=Stakelama flava TaxID=2860338 RepID=A0ABS6XJ68_9SPHN|nr:DUF418 domain-containing protein [Stakelama flava]MBW4329848.1 DUF418 domain-containing protein [Stakelama flava]